MLTRPLLRPSSFLAIAIGTVTSLWATAASAQGVNFPFCLNNACTEGIETWGATVSPASTVGDWSRTLWPRAHGRGFEQSGIFMHLALPPREPMPAEPGIGVTLPNGGSPGSDPALPIAFDIHPITRDVLRVSVNRAPGAPAAIATIGSQPAIVQGFVSDPVVRCNAVGCVGVVADSRNYSTIFTWLPAGSVRAGYIRSVPPLGARATRPAVIATTNSEFLIFERFYDLVTGASNNLRLITLNLNPATQMFEPTSDVSFVSEATSPMTFGALAMTRVSSSVILLGSFSNAGGMYSLQLDSIPYPVRGAMETLDRKLLSLPMTASPFVGLARSAGSIVITSQNAGEISAIPVRVDPMTGAIAVRPFAGAPAVNDAARFSAIAHSIVDGPLPLVAFDTFSRGVAPLRRAYGSVVGVCLNNNATCVVSSDTQRFCGTCLNYDCVNWVDCTPANQDAGVDVRDAAITDVPNVDAPSTDVPTIDVPNPMDQDVAEMDAGDARTEATDGQFVAQDGLSPEIPELQFSGGACTCRTLPATSQSSHDLHVASVLGLATLLSQQSRRIAKRARAKRTTV